MKIIKATTDDESVLASTDHAVEANDLLVTSCVVSVPLHLCIKPHFSNSQSSPVTGNRVIQMV